VNSETVAGTEVEAGKKAFEEDLRKFSAGILDDDHPHDRKHMKYKISQAEQKFAKSHPHLMKPGRMMHTKDLPPELEYLYKSLHNPKLAIRKRLSPCCCGSNWGDWGRFIGLFTAGYTALGLFLWLLLTITTATDSGTYEDLTLWLFFAIGVVFVGFLYSLIKYGEKQEDLKAEREYQELLANAKFQ
jgi:hypothetical protein